MGKFLAVLVREYKKVVFTWMFLITTFLMPLGMAFFMVVPILIFTLEGDQTRIAIIDSGRPIGNRIRSNLSAKRISEETKRQVEESGTSLNPAQNAKLEEATSKLATFGFVEFESDGKTSEKILDELKILVADNKLDAYLILPEDLDSKTAEIKFFSRKAGDLFATSAVKNAVNEAVRSERLAGANISEEMLKHLSRKVQFTTTAITETGDTKDGSANPMAGFIIASLLMTVLLVYGQAIMAAIVEEKETKISEILFSSARPFELLMGKLVGVGLAGLTQLAIWLLTLSVLVAYGLVNAVAAGMDLSLPQISPEIVIYFLVFFLLGYFIYATIYALIGSMVSNMQEGGQLILPPVLVLVIALYFCFAVIRDPNSAMSFWVSIAPFFSPIVMPVRILAETPPFWQIALAIVLNLLTVFGLVWIASRVYRVGMLMYGKRATIPEVWKWITQV